MKNYFSNLFKHSIIAICVFCSISTFAQFSEKDTSNNEFLTPIGIGFNHLQGSFSNRFTNFKSFHSGLLYKNRKQFVFGIQGSYLFGANLKDSSMFEGIINENGTIVGGTGVPSIIEFGGRGFQVKGSFGKIFTLWDKNPNNGLLLLSSLGLLQHKIFVNIPENDIPQLNKVYRKGYDRLSNGLELSQFIGYIHLAESKEGGRQMFVPTYFFGIEVSNAWIQNRRSWNYDQIKQDTKLHYDQMVNFKFGWLIRVNSARKNDFHYF